MESLDTESSCTVAAERGRSTPTNVDYGARSRAADQTGFTSMNFIRALIFGAACALLCACGSGGDSSGAPPAPPPQKTEIAWDNGNWDALQWQ